MREALNGIKLNALQLQFVLEHMIGLGGERQRHMVDVCDMGFDVTLLFTTTLDVDQFTRSLMEGTQPGWLDCKALEGEHAIRRQIKLEVISIPQKKLGGFDIALSLSKSGKLFAERATGLSNCSRQRLQRLFVRGPKQLCCLGTGIRCFRNAEQRSILSLRLAPARFFVDARPAPQGRF